MKNRTQQGTSEEQGWEQDDREDEGEDSQPVARVYEQSKRVRQDVEGLFSAAFEAKAQLESTLRERIAERPYVGLVAAAGLGYVLGAGISPRLIRTAVVLGSRVAFAALMRELTTPLTEMVTGRTA